MLLGMSMKAQVTHPVTHMTYSFGILSHRVEFYFSVLFLLGYSASIHNCPACLASIRIHLKTNMSLVDFLSTLFVANSSCTAYFASSPPSRQTNYVVDSPL